MADTIKYDIKTKSAVEIETGFINNPIITIEEPDEIAVIKEALIKKGLISETDLTAAKSDIINKK